MCFKQGRVVHTLNNSKRMLIIRRTVANDQYLLRIFNDRSKAKLTSICASPLNLLLTIGNCYALVFTVSCILVLRKRRKKTKKGKRVGREGTRVHTVGYGRDCVILVH
jgi:hypothetical protein